MISIEIILFSIILITIFVITIIIFQQEILSLKNNKSKKKNKRNTMSLKDQKLKSEKPGKIIVPNSTYETLKKENRINSGKDL